MSVQTVDFTALAPVLVLALGALVVLVSDLFGSPGSSVPGWVACAVVVVAGAVLPQTLGAATLCSAENGCAYEVDSIAWAFQLVVVGAVLVVMLMSVGVVRESGVPAGEYYFLVLASASAAVALPSTRDLVSLVVVLEVVSLPTFALVALKRDDPRSGEAALKLFLYSVVSVAVALYGVALVYGSTGTVTLAGIQKVVVVGASHTPVLAAGLVMVLAVTLFKVAAFPFHAWAPDAYQGAPVPVAAYLSVVSKLAGFAAVVLLARTFVAWPSVWAAVLAASATVTMVGANVAALRQVRAVRLMAWSSIAQAGYVLVPLSALVAGGRPRIAVLEATVAYLAIYAAMNLGAFAVVAVVARRQLDPTLADFDGLAHRRPFLGVSLAVFLAALAGLPPGLSGLFAKVGVLAVPVGTGAWWLAAAMGVATVIGLAYYLPWAARLFRRPVDVQAGDRTRVPVGLTAAASVALTVTVVLSVAPALAFGLIDR
ncbi:MAG: NADH-quinone oxidoreductase subunit N [Actinomycetes bacterium]